MKVNPANAFFITQGFLSCRHMKVKLPYGGNYLFITQKLGFTFEWRKILSNFPGK